MTELPLVGSNKLVQVDNEDVELLVKFIWHLCIDEHREYAITFIDRKPVRMHAILTKAERTDHKDGNGLNNQKVNLRPCTASQNQWNRRKNKSTQSRFKGVKPVSTYWIARIKRYGTEYYLGRFPSEELAAKAYDDKAKELFGEFANLNFK